MVLLLLMGYGRGDTAEKQKFRCDGILMRDSAFYAPNFDYLPALLRFLAMVTQ
jgi:hypothetical protein